MVQLGHVQHFGFLATFGALIWLHRTNHRIIERKFQQVIAGGCGKLMLRQVTRSRGGELDLTLLGLAGVWATSSSIGQRAVSFRLRLDFGSEVSAYIGLFDWLTWLGARTRSIDIVAGSRVILKRICEDEYGTGYPGFTQSK